MQPVLPCRTQCLFVLHAGIFRAAVSLLYFLSRRLATRAVPRAIRSSRRTFSISFNTFCFPGGGFFAELVEMSSLQTGLVAS